MSFHYILVTFIVMCQPSKTDHLATKKLEVDKKGGIGVCRRQYRGYDQLAYWRV